MRGSTQRRTLVSLSLFLGVTAAGGGLSLIAGWIPMPTSALEGSPFSTYTVPAVLLSVVIGGSGLYAAWLVYQRSALGAIVAAVSGLGIVVFEGFEWAIIGFSPLQVAYMLLGVAIVATAWGLGKADGAHLVAPRRLVRH
jgi:hypothetical protein